MSTNDSEFRIEPNAIIRPEREKSRMPNKLVYRDAGSSRIADVRMKSLLVGEHYYRFWRLVATVRGRRSGKSEKRKKTSLSVEKDRDQFDLVQTLFLEVMRHGS